MFHLCVLHSNEYRNHVRRYCDDCQQNALRGGWLVKCPRCEEVIIYLKHGWAVQELYCEGCYYSFHTTDNTCSYAVGLCPCQNFCDSTILQKVKMRPC